MTNRWFQMNGHYYSLDAFSEFKVEWRPINKYVVIGVLKTPRRRVMLSNTVKSLTNGYILIENILAGEYDVEIKSSDTN